MYIIYIFIQIKQIIPEYRRVHFAKTTIKTAHIIHFYLPKNRNNQEQKYTLNNIIYHIRK